MIHALVVSFIGLTLIYTQTVEYGAKNTPEQVYILNLSFGYFLYDFVSVSIYEIMDGKF